MKSDLASGADRGSPPIKEPQGFVPRRPSDVKDPSATLATDRTRGSLIDVATHTSTPLLGQVPTTAGLADLPEVPLCLANAAVFVVATACHLLTVGVRTGALALGLVVALCCVALPVRYAALTGLSAWGFFTGFVVNAGGQLTFAHDDLTRMLLLVAVGVLASSARAHGHWRRSKATYEDARHHVGQNQGEGMTEAMTCRGKHQDDPCRQIVVSP